MKEKPFNLTPDPAFLFYSNAHRKAVAFLKYGLEESKGFLQLTGPVGSGKTTLLRTILAQLDEKTRTAYIINPCASFSDLLRSIMKDLEIPAIPETQSKIELLDFFHDFLLVQMKRSQPVITIFDEAQNLSIKNLEEIRMLSNFETTKEKLIQIVFVGQPELIKKLDRPELRQLKQRIQVRYHLAALTLPEVKEYINHRLSVAGSDGKIVFTDDACTEIFNFSGGIPRLINSVCDIVLLIGYVNERKKFDAASVKEALNEMNGSFDDEPMGYMQEEEASRKTLRDLQTRENIPVSDGARTEEDNMAQSSDSAARTPTEVSSAPGPEGIIKTEEYGQGEKIHPTGACLSVAEAVIETEPCPPPAPPEVDQSDECSPTAETQVEQRFLFKSLYNSLTQRKKTKAGRLATNSEHGENKPQTLATLIPERSMSAKNGSTAITQGNTSRDYADSQSLPSASDDTQSPCPEEETGTLTDMMSTGQTCGAEISDKDRPAKDVGAVTWPRKARRNGWILKNRMFGLLTGHSASRKAVILLKNGKTVRGTIENIDLTADGFRFRPHSIRHIFREEILSFEQILAIRLAEDCDNGRDEIRDVKNYLPKGRQILVTLSNGDLIEGITLSKFDPGCQRFFVISPDDKGDTSWMLLERSGTAGILTDGYKEGIYSEEYEILPDIDNLYDGEMLTVCQHEIAGDFYFSINDHLAATTEYTKALANADNAERLEKKISVACFNRGVECLRINQYLRAREHFEKASKNIHLREKIKSKIEQIERMRRGNPGGQ